MMQVNMCMSNEPGKETKKAHPLLYKMKFRAKFPA